MEKSAQSIFGELLKALLKLPKSSYRGAKSVLDSTGIGPFVKALGESGASGITKSFRRNPYITTGAGLAGGGLLGLGLSNFGEDEPEGYFNRMRKFWAKAQGKMGEAYPGSQSANPMYWAGKGIREFGVNPILKPLIGSMSAGPFTAGTLGALAGSGIGGLTGLIRGGFGDVIPSALVGAGIGGVGMGGLSSLAHRSYPNADGMTSWGFSEPWQNPFTAHDRMMKEGSVKRAGQFGTGFDAGIGNVVPNQSHLKANIYRQPSTILSLRQKQELSDQVSLLTPYQLKRLSQLLRGVGGAGVAFVIAKYLLGLGKKSTIVSVILGGIAGAMSVGGSQRNSMGYNHRF